MDEVREVKGFNMRCPEVTEGKVWIHKRWDVKMRRNKKRRNKNVQAKQRFQR